MTTPTSIDTEKGGLAKSDKAKQPKDTKSITEIVAYLEHPKVVRELTGDFEGMSEVEYDGEKLREMIYALSDAGLSKLIERVTTVCSQWSALRVAPNNDIGTVARYQEADLIIQQRVNDLVATDKDTSND